MRVNYMPVLARKPGALRNGAPFSGCDGDVSKRRDAIYRSGRQESWIKLKCTKSDNFPIIAFVEKLEDEAAQDCVALSRPPRGRRTGYTEQVAREVRERLDALITSKCPLDVPIKKPKATWVQPVVDAEIEYSGVTDDGLLRAAVFKGLRDDLAPARPSAPRMKRV